MNHIRDPLGIPRDSIQDERALGVGARLLGKPDRKKELLRTVRAVSGQPN